MFHPIRFPRNSKVALLRGYFIADLMIITSGFLLISSKEEKKSLIPLTVRFLLYYGIPNIRFKKIFAGDENENENDDRRSRN